MPGIENPELEDIILLPESRGGYASGCSAVSAVDISALDDNTSSENGHSLRGWWHEILRNYGSFHCYAFFLCLPSDTEALQYLKDFSNEIDLLSGSNCLVIAVSKSDFKRFGFSKEGIWKAAISEQVSKGYSTTIARRFNIDFTDFPCLVLFENIRSSKRITFTFKGLSSEEISSQMRLIFSLVQQARLENIKPITKLEKHQKEEGFQKVGQTILDKVTSFTGRTFEAAVQAWIKTII